MRYTGHSWNLETLRGYQRITWTNQMTTRAAAETTAQMTVPVPVSISGLTFIGITVKDWVLIGTAVLLVFQIIVIAPKAYRALRAGRRNITSAIKGAFRRVCK